MMLLVMSSLILVLLCVAWLLPVASTTQQAMHHKDNTFFPHHNAKHHGNSRNFYIDLGANDGSSIVAFTNQVHSGTVVSGDGSTELEGGWKGLVARPDNVSAPLSSWHIIAFEAGEGHTPALHDIQKNLTDTKSVASIKIYNATAISTRDGTIEFIWDLHHKADAGSTTMRESASANGQVVVVPCMDIVTLFRKEHITIDDFVVMKVDIEGAEFDLVRKIITSGLYRYIDKLAVEW